MPDEWRKNITFTDRLSKTSKIVSAYKTAHPDCDKTAASQYAKAEEDRARKDALNLVEYDDLCAKAVQILLASAHQPTTQDEYSEEHHFPNLPSTGATIGRYINADHFADGLFSEVFRAHDPASKTADGKPVLVALKVTNPSVMTPPHNSIREARILSAVKSDRVIPLLEQFRQPEGTLVLAYPYMPVDLSKLLEQQRLTPDSRKSILLDIFTGLAHVHSLDIIHRDVKPSNILLRSPSGPAYLADFGIAWSASDPASEPMFEKIRDVGTTCYRPPELLFGYSAYGTQLDMWAAGCVAAQVVCLNGKTLFDAGDLGSELALIKSMFQTLGTPDVANWPEANTMPDWGKMNFTKYSAKTWDQILPDAQADARELTKNLVQYESAWRLTAKEALQHPYLQNGNENTEL